MSTDYAGEGIYIAVTSPKTWDGKRAITPDDVHSVTLEIYNNDYSAIVYGPVEMQWSTDDATWVIVWDTSNGGMASPVPVPPGTYKAKITIVDVDGVPSIEFQRHRLKRRLDVPAL